MFLNGVGNSCLSWITRFFGSKTWSIPQFIFYRTQQLFFNNHSLSNSNWNSTNYEWTFLSQQDSELEVKTNLYKYMMGAVPKSENTEWIKPFQIKLISPTTLNINLSQLPGVIETKENSFVDYTTGFKATVAESEASNEILVGFGATDSLLRDAKSKGLKYILSAGLSFLGGTPLIYNQADEFLKKLKSVYPDKSIILSGTCLGASLAQYVAFQQGVQAFCLNSLPLGVGLQAKIGNQKLRENHNNIHHITIKNELFGDRRWITLIDKFVSVFFDLRTQANHGIRYSVPGMYNSAILDHDYPLDALIKVIAPEHTVSVQSKHKRQALLTLYKSKIKSLIEENIVSRPQS